MAMYESSALQRSDGRDSEATHRVLVSLIVPVYNSEETLPQLFDCIDAQTLESFEVIFVDDGSSDSSLELLQNYAALRSNVTVIRQENSGPGIARNAGLELARGSYIAFADSDDTFLPDFLLAPYQHAIATSSDFVIFDYEAEFAHDLYLTMPPSLAFREAIYDKVTVSWRDIPSNVLNIAAVAVWHMLWSRNFIETNNLTFSNLYVAEDRLFTTEAILKAERISYLPMTLYTHDESPHDSLSGAFVGEHLLANLTASERIIDMLGFAGDCNTLRLSAARALVSTQLWYITSYKGQWSDAESREYVTRLHKLLNGDYFSGVGRGDFLDLKHEKFFLVMRDSKPKEVIDMLANEGIDRLLNSLESQSGAGSSGMELSGVPGVSIVVPVYNAEAYLPKLFACFDAQTFQDFEVLFIDDGSSDGSLSLLEDYVSHCNNAALIVQPNRGAGAARNTGIELTSGEYIAFIDADDAITATYLENLYSKATRENADVVVYGYTDVFKGEEITHYPRICDMPEFKEKSVFSWRDDPERVLTISGEQATCTRMYRRTFLLEKNLQYPEISATNDWPFSVLAILQAERIAWLHEAPYIAMRRLDNNSITARKKMGHKLAALQACEFTLHGVQQLPHYENIRLAVWDFVAKAIRTAVSFYDWGVGANEEMKAFLARVPSMCRDYGITDEDIEGCVRKDSGAGVLLRVLLECPAEKIESILSSPFVLALHAQQLDDVVPVIETEAERRGKLDFQFSFIDVYLSSGESDDSASTPEALEDFIDSGWLRVHQLDEDVDSAWILEVLKNNPEAHLVCASMDRAARAWLGFNHLVAMMLEHTGAVIAWSTRNVFLQDGSAIEPEYWLETATMYDEPSTNQWVGTGGYYLIPCGVLDYKKVVNLYSQMPKVLRDDEEYVLNAVLQSCGVPVVAGKRELPIARGIGGSGHIHDIDCAVLEWIEANRVPATGGITCGGNSRKDYLEMAKKHYAKQRKANRRTMRATKVREQTLEYNREKYSEPQDTVDALAAGIADFGSSDEDRLESQVQAAKKRAAKENQELGQAQRRVARLEGELNKARSASGILSALQEENSPLINGGEGLEWSEPEEREINILASPANYQHYIALVAQPGHAYRVSVRMESGSASGIEMQLYNSEKKTGSHRKRAKKGKSVEFSFGVIPDSDEIKLCIYPEGIGKTSGYDASIHVEIQTATI